MVQPLLHFFLSMNVDCSLKKSNPDKNYLFSSEKWNFLLDMTYSFSINPFKLRNHKLSSLTTIFSSKSQRKLPTKALISYESR